MRKILGIAAAITITHSAQAIDIQAFANLALKSGGAIVGECPSQIMTKDEVLSSGIESGIFKVTTQTKINGSKQSAYVINPVIKPAKRGCVYKAQKIDITKSGTLTIKNQ
jgi:hypothetical protein